MAIVAALIIPLASGDCPREPGWRAGATAARAEESRVTFA
jgi:hypothetical protein